MTDKTYKVAGIATCNKNVTKVRYANDLVSRVKVLTKSNFTNIQLVELSYESDKFEACQQLLKLTDFVKYHDIINTELDRLRKLDDAISVKLKKQELKLALTNNAQTVV